MSENTLRVLPLPRLEEMLERLKCQLASYSEVSGVKDDTAYQIDGLRGLHERLSRWHAREYPNSYIARWWEEGYLGGREAVSLGSNFCLQLFIDEAKRGDLEGAGTKAEGANGTKSAKADAINSAQSRDVEGRSASAAAFLARTILALKSTKDDYLLNTFDGVRNFLGHPLCRTQLGVLRGCARRLERGIDSLHFYGNPTHIALMHKNNLYRLDIDLAVDDANLYSLLKTSIASIINSAMPATYSPLTLCFEGIDSTNKREDKDSHAEQKLALFAKNKEFFSTLESALLSISIIDETFDTREAKTHNALYLRGENAYMLKPLNFIYNLADGSFFINGEHTYIDGLVMLEILGYVKARYEALAPISCAANKASETIEIAPIAFSMDKEDERLLASIKAAYNKQTQRYAFKEVHIEAKKLAILKQQGVKYSKDFLAQAMIQYAYYEGFSRFASSYEAVDMKEYKLGRTECIRPTSKEMYALILALHGKVASNSKLASLFARAEARHKEMIADAKAGQGFDRYFFAMDALARRDARCSREERDAIAAIVNAGIYIDYTKNSISTTSVGINPLIGLPIFTPVCEGGIGVGYGIGGDDISFMLSYECVDEKKIKGFAGGLVAGYTRLVELI